MLSQVFQSVRDLLRLKPARYVLHAGPVLGKAAGAGVLRVPVVTSGAKPLPVRVLSVEVDGRPWRLVSSLANARDADPVYTLDVAGGKILFGDGARGRRPGKGSRVAATYRYARGVSGKVVATYESDAAGLLRLVSISHAGLSLGIDEDGDED